MKRSLLPLVLVTATLATASCGGGGSNKPLSKSDYEAQVGAILEPLNTSALPRIASISPADPKQAERSLKKVESSLREAASKLAAVNPPADAASPTAQLAQGVKRLADEVGEMRKQAAGGSFAKLEQFKLANADPAVQEVRSAATQLIGLNYNITGGG